MTDPEARDRARRAAARAGWALSRYALDEQPGDDLSASTTAAERIEMVEELTREAWSLAGRELLTYARSQTPVRVLRPRPGGTDADAP